MVVLKLSLRRKNNHTFLELLQHGVQFSIIEDKVQRMIVELGDSCHGCAVIWVYQSQVFYIKDFHNVGPKKPKCI